jgi:hypothetical protein
MVSRRRHVHPRHAVLALFKDVVPQGKHLRPVLAI